MSPRERVIRVGEVPSSNLGARLKGPASAGFFVQDRAHRADTCRNVPELTAKQPHRPGADERRRRAEALERHRGDIRARRLDAGGRDRLPA